MTYTDIVKTIEVGKHIYVDNNNIYPNEVIISRELFELLKLSNSMLLRKTDTKEIDYTICGLNITIDERRNNIIKIAYTETMTTDQ